MAIAICIQCGHVKKRRIDICEACDFLADSPEDKAKALILSTEYDIGDEYLGMEKEELLAIAPKVAAGEYRFNEREVVLLAAFGEHVMGTPKGVLFADGVKAFGPGLFFLLGMLAIVWLC
jgi:hypothetical protein